MLFQRDTGILMHPTSLPGPYGVGDLGPECHRWLDWLADTGQTLWQILPLGPTGYGDSPYQALSSFALNPSLISLDWLVEEGLLTPEEAATARVNQDSSVDFERVHQLKAPLVAKAHQNFWKQDECSAHRRGFEAFMERERFWLQDYALYAALKTTFGRKAWTDWPSRYRDRDPVALKGFLGQNRMALSQIIFEQYILWQQWSSLRAHARELGIRILGDVPVFAAHDSADAWVWRELFQLNPDGSCRVIAGVPPDYFCATGQRWGNPLYAWEAHLQTRFTWWLARMRQALAWTDIVRIDHFRGFAAYWEIPGDAPTAEGGRWVEAPGRAFLEALGRECGQPLPVIAEDLGVITPDVEALRDDFGLPGIRILQFAFGDDPMKHTFLPESYSPNCVAYTGTHDNDTVQGWFHQQPGENNTSDAEVILREKKTALAYFKSDGSTIHWDFIRALLDSAAGATIVPTQDILGLGSEARMNMPGRASGSWRWRLTDWTALDRVSDQLTALCQHTQRGHFAHRGTASCLPSGSAVPPEAILAS